MYIMFELFCIADIYWAKDIKSHIHISNTNRIRYLSKTHKIHGNAVKYAQM